MGVLTPCPALAAVALAGQLVALLAQAACYAPRLPDCTVPCSSDLDCPPDQSCGAEGSCTAPDLICAPLERPDAPPPLPLVRLRVQVERGAVEVQGIGECDGAGWQELICMFDVPQQVPLTLIATAHPRYKFDKWSGVCEGQGPTCSVILSAPFTEARTRFRPQ